jgi:5-methylcytosine-specific restriction endonuclease McrA
MKGSPHKRPRLKLSSTSYRKLWRQVLKRDGWRCQNCGSLAELQVHHINSRGRLGDDAETNLVTLCANCHQEVHSKG